jgi:hypothetical protein
MIGITISGDAYAVIASILWPGCVDLDIVPGGEYQIWLPQAVVIRLLGNEGAKRDVQRGHPSAGGARFGRCSHERRRRRDIYE